MTTLVRLLFTFIFFGLLIRFSNDPESPLQQQYSSVIAAPNPQVTCIGIPASVYNESSRAIWITYTRFKSGSITECEYHLDMLSQPGPSPLTWDAEAIWAYCDNAEPSCEDNRRPFKIGSCTGCLHVLGEGNVLRVSGTSFCDSHCGWVDRTNGWDHGWDDAAPPPRGVLYNLDLRAWTCVGLNGGICITQRPPVPTLTPISTNTPKPVTPTATIVSPPDSNSIKIVSVSSHNVQPGQQFNPSVKIQLESGQLLPPSQRGDHLHAIPEDTTNTFGARPVQVVRYVVNAGGEYTFDINNEPEFRMTAPNTPGTYISRWQMRVGGNYIGPVIEIPITVGSVVSPPRPAGWRAQYWNGYYTDNPWGNGRCKEDDYTVSLPFTKYWGGGGPGGGCNGERFSVLYERRFDFTGGRYRFHCHRDGYCRIFIPELSIDHAEEAGSFAGMDWGVDIPAGNWEVKIEYSHRRENGDSRLEFWWQGPDVYLPPLDVDCTTNPYEWCAAYRVAWNSPSDSYILRRLEGFGYLDHDWGSDSPGYGIYGDFAAVWSRLAKFDAGLYRFHVLHDEGTKIKIDGQEVLNQWGTCCREDTVDVWLTSGDHHILVDWFDSSGNANIKVWWEKITACYRLDTQTDPPDAGTIILALTPNCPIDSTKYIEGTTINVQTQASASYDFWLWRGEINDATNPVTVVMNWDKTLTAHFLSKPTVTPIVVDTPTATPIHTSTFAVTPTPAAESVELLSQPWHLAGNNGADEAYQDIAPNVLQGRDMLQITFNLHGMQAIGNDASAIIFDQPVNRDWHYISLANYGQNGLDGQQTVNIPLSAFPGLNLNESVGTLHTRFWYSNQFAVDILSIVAYSSQGSSPLPPTSTSTAPPTKTYTPTQTPTNTLVLPTSTATKTPLAPTATNTPVPPTPTTVTCTGRITGLALFDINAGQLVPDYNSIPNSATISLANLPLLFNLKAITSGAVDSVRFSVNGATFLQNDAPYHSPEDTVAWSVTAGSYLISATAFSQDNAAGAVCDTQSLTINFVTPANTSTTTPVPPSATPTVTSTPASTPIPTPTSGVNGVELLTQPWHLVGNNGAAEAYQAIAPNVLQGKNTLRVTYNLHGLKALGGDASAIIFDQNGWQYISLSNYGKNGFNGVQTVDIPLSAFTGLNLSANVGTLHTRFWYNKSFIVDITSIVAYFKEVAASAEMSEIVTNTLSLNDNTIYLPVISR